ncbi:basic proline-rich protein isoform X2 [Folsomia candida]|nr:basic proline-rich protein isoform X2 [Folsomia candida]
MRVLILSIFISIFVVVECNPGGWGWEEPPRPPPTKGWRPHPPPPTKGWRPPPTPPTKGWRPPPPPTKGWKPPPPPPTKGWGWSGGDSIFGDDDVDEAPIIKFYCETLRRIVDSVSECPRRPSRPRPPYHDDNHGGYQKGGNHDHHGGYDKGHSGYVAPPRSYRDAKKVLDTEDYDWKW